jgi:Cu-processing system ATP-binding protein
MIQIQHLTKRFRNIKALDDINISFMSGDVVSLIGPNGSGKTTLIKSILGMVRPDSGSVLVNNVAIDKDPLYRNCIGYMPQIGRYPDNMKIGQLFRMMRDIRKTDEQKLDNDLLDRFNLPAIFDKPLRTLSGGTRQKVSAALAFYFNPEILILDEPTAGLDPLSSEILKEKILEEKSRGKLILITSHILSDLEELTTRVMFLQEGKMIFCHDIEVLREQTGQQRLGKAIAAVMKGELPKVLKYDGQSFTSIDKLK